MKLVLLKTFGSIGFNFKIENETVIAIDNHGNILKEGIDYYVKNLDNSKSLEVEQANGICVTFTVE